MRILLASALLALAALGAPPARADFVFGDYVFTTVHPSVAFTSALRLAPDGRVFAAELQTGRVRVYADTSVGASSSIWVQLPVRTDGERGLLGLAFHPSFPDSPWVYVLYTPQGASIARIARMRDAGGVGVDFATILDGLPAAASIHHGGRLAFGSDGMLYVTRGDQANAALSQLATGTEGRILRLTPLGEPAPGNPFGGGNPGYANGVRNAFGLCFDPVSGAGYFTENGPNCTDELNVLLPGANYGWGPSWLCESVPSGTTAPLVTYTPTIAPTGCTVYRGTRLAALDGDVFFCGYNDGVIYRAEVDHANPFATNAAEPWVTTESFTALDVTTGPDGLLWISGGSAIYKIRPYAPVLDTTPVPSPRALAVAPNPARGAVRFTLPSRGADRLEVVDVAGRVVRTWSGPLAGEVVWDGADADGRAARPGVYFVRARRGGLTDTRSFVRLGP